MSHKYIQSLYESQLWTSLGSRRGLTWSGYKNSKSSTVQSMLMRMSLSPKTSPSHHYHLQVCLHHHQVVPTSLILPMFSNPSNITTPCSYQIRHATHHWPPPSHRQCCPFVLTALILLTSKFPICLWLVLWSWGEKLESVRIGKCQNRKVSELDSVRIGKCQNRKVSELESVKIGHYNWVCKKILIWLP